MQELLLASLCKSKISTLKAGRILRVAVTAFVPGGFTLNISGIVTVWNIKTGMIVRIKHVGCCRIILLSFPAKGLLDKHLFCWISVSFQTVDFALHLFGI